MKKLARLIGFAALVGLTPYRFAIDRETRSYEIGGLLWSLKKECGEESDTFTLELLPFIGSEATPAQEVEE